MPSAKTAPAPPEDEPDESPAQAREQILAKMENKWKEEHEEWNRVNHVDPAATRVRETIKSTSSQEKKKQDKKIEGRKLKRYNVMIKIHFIVHQAEKDGKPPTEERIIVETVDSIYLNDMKKLVAARIGTKKKIKLLWLDAEGETVALDTQEAFKQYVDREWCRLPWIIHCYEDSIPATNALTLTDTAKALFDRFDANANGTLEKAELARMLKELDRERLQLSESMIESFIISEFAETDVDKSGALSLSEFTQYVTSMASWMRQELMERAHHKNVFGTLAARAIEVMMAPQATPQSSSAQTVKAPKFGLTVEVPGNSNSISSLQISTLAPIRIEPFFDDEKRRRGEFSIRRRLDIERADGKAPGDKFDEPLILTMPHCFCANDEVGDGAADGMESTVMLGCPTGETQWKVLDALMTKDLSNPVTLEEGIMRVQIPFPGIFCAFSSPDVEDICRVRIHLFTLPVVPTDVPTSVRLHICPELPDQIEELELSESSEWGLSTRAGDSQVLHLYQGATLEFELQGITKQLTWHGSRIKTTFTYQPTKEALSSYFDDIKVSFVEGEGKRAGRVEATAKRAGIPATGYVIPFKVVPSMTKPPPPPVVDKETSMHERSQYDFTITWKAPVIEPPELPVVKYAIELSTCGESGTYMAFQEIWQGMPKQLFRVDEEGAIVPPDLETPLHYTLEVDPGLFGRIRLRCWNGGERRPSAFSEELKLERYQGKFENEKTLERKALEAKRLEYMGAPHEVSPNLWSSNPTVDPTLRREPSLKEVEVAKKKKEEKKAKVELAPVPYDMPLPDGAKGGAVQECGRALAAFYEEVGVDGGGSGTLFGLRIDHVIHAILAGSTECTLHQPLMALTEVMLFDALQPMLETVVVLRDEWIFVLEKVWGQVQQISSLRTSYLLVIEQIKDVLFVLLDLRDTMRQCEQDLLLHLHLVEKEYPRSVRRDLKQEVLDRMVDIIWRMSTELLKMQLYIKENSDKKLVPHQSDVVKMQFVDHLNQSNAKRKKGVFSWLRKSR